MRGGKWEWRKKMEKVKFDTALRVNTVDGRKVGRERWQLVENPLSRIVGKA